MRGREESASRLLRVAVVLLALGGAAPSTSAGEAEDAVAVSISSGPRSPVAGQEVRVTVDIRIQGEFFREHAVLPTLRGVDIPLRLLVPELEGLPGIRHEPGSPAGATMMFEDRVVSVASDNTVHQPGGPLRRIALVWTFFPQSPGPLEIAAPEVRWSWTSAFEEDALGQRRPVDLHEVTVRGEPVTVDVQPLPPGAEPGAVPAVGSFTLSRAGPAGPVTAGVPFPMKVRVDGHGNFQRFDAPKVVTGDRFHVFGLLEDRHPDGATFTFDIAALDTSPDRLPKVLLPYFDPEEGKWRVAVSGEAPLEVLPGAKAASPGPEVAPVPGAPAPGDGGSPWRAALIALVVSVAAALLFRLRSRRGPPRTSPPPAPSALDAFRDALAGPDADAGAALATFLGACTGTGPAAAVADGLVHRLVAAGAPPETAARAADLLRRLQDRRYAGLPPDAADVAAAEEVAVAVAAGIAAGAAGEGAKNT